VESEKQNFEEGLLDMENVLDVEIFAAI